WAAAVPRQRRRALAVVALWPRRLRVHGCLVIPCGLGSRGTGVQGRRAHAWVAVVRGGATRRLSMRTQHVRRAPRRRRGRAAPLLLQGAAPLHY
ncbi:MAG: hypothetical protein J3K34DRAFT_408212, partial [Monoraphidium minutum]